jgi:formyltetrahydrofolate-dependent phosphoribosylglycinamide formyltransferase
MFRRLQSKWGVSTHQFWIIFIAFGLTGTTTAIITRFVAAWLGLGPESFWLWKLLLRVSMLLLGYQVLLLGYGALLGQWAFFWKYERKLLQKLGILPKNTLKLAIFASGAGSNAAKILEHFKHHPTIRIDLIVCNKPGAGVLDIAAQHQVPTLIIEREKFLNGDAYLPFLNNIGIDFLVLAGFLWKIPPALVAAYPNKIVNIHPALLPKYGGKGMYGARVHEAVIAAGDKESGITIHFVNEQYDEGASIFQAICSVDQNDDADSLAHKIHALEHAHFPVVLEKLLNK